ncbi:hypothetical protein [Desulfohalovibrio reitneri]|uniref:hypothetical protein n=1 Tax=Desulfohalovibrio reitneri TaxID=1307759 RepID=UPI0004A73443|nr:hypothetical protein [Desulfohalovibrio reitneri]
MDLQPLIQTMPAQAFWFGALSAASLPLGAALGILWKRPSARAISAIMAFGAGSLLAALALELVAPALERGGYTPLAIGAVAGGCSFFCWIGPSTSTAASGASGPPSSATWSAPSAHG